MDALNVDLMEIDWYELKALCDGEGDPDCSMFKELLILTLLQLSIKHCPPKTRPPGARKSKVEQEIISENEEKKVEQEDPLIGGK